ncbi:MAG: sulfatase-like hydrolase/transferase [Verrucomicrobiota bacterium]
MKRVFAYIVAFSVSAASLAADQPNIVWIVGEDASAHLSCYGETQIETPHLDKLAAGGVRFDHAFVTCPVCSPSRSAMVTGMYQTTLGAHNHRSQTMGGKGGGYPAYHESYKLPVKSIPELFREAGYFVTNATDASCKGTGKTDYNFVTDGSLYDGADWRAAAEAVKPFFALFQLRGGKSRKNNQTAVDPAEVDLPPYYPDHPVIREDWATYLNSWIDQDRQVGEVLASLEGAGVADETIVFFWTDHGVSHARGKQFLYEEGIRVPLIAHFPDGKQAGVVRDDLVIHIDVAATSLALAGIEIPDHVQGVDLFAENYEPRDRIFSARDRCDETVEIMRCVRTKRFKYIRNFVSYVPHLQPNQYKDGKLIIQTIRQLHAEDELTPLQAKLFAIPRPRAELYDLEADPHETTNLAELPEHAEVLTDLRNSLTEWMIDSRDLGLIPEPLLEDFGAKAGNKYALLQSKLARGTVRDLIQTIEKGERGEDAGLDDPSPSIRFWAATWAGVNGDESAVPKLRQLLEDDWEAVQIAGALALCRLGSDQEKAIDLLAAAIDSENHITSMYAIRGIECSGVRNETTKVAADKAAAAKYEFTRRIGRRLQKQHAALSHLRPSSSSE